MTTTKCYIFSDLSQGSDEILFEIYNPATGGGSADNTFVGLAIVGINELVKTNNPTQYLKLQSRPYHNDNVNGTLLVQVCHGGQTTVLNNPWMVLVYLFL